MVVAGGSLESPALLLRSQIGGPAVGRYLRLHPSVAVFGYYLEDQRSWWGPPHSGLSDEFADIQDGYGFLIEATQYTTGLGCSALPWVTGREHKELLSQKSQLVLKGGAQELRIRCHTTRSTRLRAVSGGYARGVRAGLLRESEGLGLGRVLNSYSTESARGHCRDPPATPGSAAAGRDLPWPAERVDPELETRFYELGVAAKMLRLPLAAACDLSSLKGPAGSIKSTAPAMTYGQSTRKQPWPGST